MRRIEFPKDAPFGLPTCGVVSVAMLAGVSYQEAADKIWEIRHGGRRGQDGRRHSWKGRTWMSERVKALRAFDVPLVRRHDLEGLTLNQLNAVTDVHLISAQAAFAHHVVTLHAGKVYDQWYRNGEPVTQYFRGRRHKMKALFEVYGPAGHSQSVLLQGLENHW